MSSRLSLFSSTKPSHPNVNFTLPITCQICLGKVKDPSVCPNLHAFCTSCIDLWLEKTKQCPTCRVPIDKENPCRRILGGIDNQDDADLIKPTEFSHPGTRKARFMNFFQQYEDEISRLNSLIDSLTEEVTKLKECNKNPISNSSESSDDSSSITKKLQDVQNNLDQVVKERDELRQLNTKLESENSMLIQDISSLKATLSEKNSQMTSKYTMAAMESKIESYEKEIKRLQKALEKSDRYIAELESSKNLKEKENKISEVIANNSTTAFNFTIPSSHNEIKSDLRQTSPVNDPPSARKNIIPKINFYGSPSKTPTRQVQIVQSVNIPSVSSFGDRLKKNLFNTPAPAFASNFISNHSAAIISSDQTPTISNCNQENNNLLFSPMKRLRLEENANKAQNVAQNLTISNLSHSNYQTDGEQKSNFTQPNDSQVTSSSFLNTMNIINESM